MYGETTGRSPIEIDLVLERADSKHVRWTIVSDQSSSTVPNLEDYIGLFTCDLFYLPDELQKLEVGERVKLTGSGELVFSKSWTQCGYEHDVDLEWEPKFIVGFACDTCQGSTTIDGTLGASPGSCATTEDPCPDCDEGSIFLKDYKSPTTCGNCRFIDPVYGPDQWCANEGCTARRPRFPA